jgi:rare lipoprotein A
MLLATMTLLASASMPPSLPCCSEIVLELLRRHTNERLERYEEESRRHRMAGLASYYSSFFDGRKTANGEMFRNRKYSAAHLTLPMGTWVEVRSRATGRTLRLRINDRGPFVKKFALDLSQAAARKLGVDTARDRYVEMRILALPGEEPLSDELLLIAGQAGSVRQNVEPSPGSDSTVTDPP